MSYNNSGENYPLQGSITKNKKIHNSKKTDIDNGPAHSCCGEQYKCDVNQMDNGH